MARLRSQTMYVLLFLTVIHVGAFAATRILIAEQKTHIEAVWRLLLHQERLRDLVHFQLVHCVTCRMVGHPHMCESSTPLVGKVGSTLPTSCRCPCFADRFITAA